jgi:hypothetical protein
LPPAALRLLPSLPARVGTAGRAASPPTVVAEEARAALLGRAVHRTLEWAARTPVVTDLDRLAAAAAREYGADAGEVRRHAAAILAHADTARFFRGPQIRWSGNEVPVSESGPCCASTGWCSSKGRAASRSGGCSTTSCAITRGARALPAAAAALP